MANGRQRGGLGTLPFPTFNAGGQGGVIPQLQLRPAPIRFPQAGGGGGGGSRGSNTGLAALLPYGIQAIADRYGTTKTVQPRKRAPLPLEGRGGITRKDMDEYISNQAGYMADQLYGPTVLEEKNLLGKLAPVASFLGAAAFNDPSEQAAYVQSYGNILSSKATTKDDPKAQFTADYVKAQMGRTYGVAPAYKIGDETQARNAIKSPNGQFFIHSKGEEVDRDVQGNLIEAGKYYVSPDWIVGEPPAADLSKLNTSSNNAEKEWVKARTGIETTNDMLLSALPAINTVLQTTISSPEVTTWFSPLNRLKTEVTVAAKKLFQNNEEEYRLAEKNGQITWYKPSEGVNENSAISDTSQDQFVYLDEVLNPETGQMMTIEKTYSWKATFGDIAQDAAFRSAMLNLAYVAAASTGNTGKALSDRDLALHLLQLGAPFEGGGTKAPEAVIRSITDWYGNQIRKLDTQARALETGSLGADYRRLTKQATPWAEKWYSGEPDEKLIRKIISPTASWIRSGEEELLKYRENLYQAQKKYGDSVISQDPLIGFDYQSFLRNRMNQQLPEGSAEGTVPVPPATSRIFNPKPQPTT